MTAATSRLRRRGIGAGVSALVGLTSVVGLAAAAHAAPGFTFPDANRVAGADRYATAIDASTTAFPTGTQAGGVVLVSGTSTVDGLTASYVAGSHNAPILLVKNGVIDSATLAEIARLNVTNVWIVGGTSVVPESVATQLTGKTIVRYNGADRYETAAKAATNNGTVTTQPGKVFIASGTADALAAAPVLYNKKYPLLLTRPGSVPATTTDALGQLTTTSRTVLGGTTAVDAGTYATLGGTARLQGANRYETATAIADSAVTNEGFSRANVAVANGTDSAAVDSLTGSVVAGKNGVPLIFVNGTDTNPTATTTYLSMNNAALTGQLYVFGGATVVPAASANAVVATATAAPVATSINVTPTDAITQTVASETGTTPTTDDRTYTVTGLAAGTTYRITLVNGDSIRTATNGAVTFLADEASNASGNKLVNPGADIADITGVNNAAPTFATGDAAAARTTTVVPVNGSITFTVDGTAPGTVVPVIYINGGAGGTASNGGTSPRLETTATTAGSYAPASESYGLGGAVTYTAPLAGAGTITGTSAAGTGGPVVTSVDKANDSFNTTVVTAAVTGPPAVPATSTTSRYTYDSNDTFSINNGTTTNSVGLSQFEAALSSGDGISGTFAPDGGVSNFVLADTNPAAPTTVVAAQGTTNATGNDITVTVTPAAGDFDSVVIQRASVTGSTGASDGTVGTYATIASPTTDADLGTAGFQYVDNDVPAGTYRYRAAVINDGDQGDYKEDATNEASVAPNTDTTAPTVLDTRLVGTAAGSPFLIDPASGTGGTTAGDNFVVVASEPFAPITTGDAFRLTDSDGTIVDLINGSNATFSLNTAAQSIGGTSYAIGQVLTVTVGTFTAASPGTTAGLAVGANITQQSGNTDVAGNQLVLTGDVAVDNES